MNRTSITAAIIFGFVPTTARAHDAFGDLGPFYASFLHPLADPMQAALVMGAAAFLVGRSLDEIRIALPVFVIAASLSHLLLLWRLDMSLPPLVPAAVAVAVGGGTMLPDAWVRGWVALALVAATGLIVGLAPDRPPAADALQPLLGACVGIAVLVTLAWAVLDATARHFCRLVPRIAGSWVAAVGLLVGAFVLQPAQREGTGMLPAPATQTSEGSDR